MRNTFMANVSNIDTKWYIVDAKGMTTGRLAAAVAKVLIGKHKPTYTAHVDCGDNVIIINADKVVFTGNKLKNKIYYNYSGYQGGLKETTAGEMLANKPERVLELAIKGMLPKTKLGRQMYKKLYVYASAQHPHEAQKPQELSQESNTWFVR